MEKDFEKFMSQLQETNQGLDFFCDFEKIQTNVDQIKLSLCMLNSLLGSQDLRRSVETIWQCNKNAFEVLEILIAVRHDGRKVVLNSCGECVPLTQFFKSVEGVMEFLESTGLAKLFVEGKIKDLVDYVFGIETGLDSNARKNRGGHLMEKAVAQLLSQYEIPFRTEVYSSEWSEITKVLGDDKKRFDFVFQSKGITYLMEVNFYSSSGSKLNEVARSYSEIAPKINAVAGFEFVWITDGIGWRAAKNKLQEAYSVIPHIYNLTNVTEFLQSIG